MPGVVLTVPCFNEERRFAPAEFRRIASHPRVSVLFVDDGSSDRTPEVLAAFAAEDPTRARVLTLEQNEGKAEAVRRGMCEALAGGAEIVGFTDADLSTPAEEVLRLVETIAGDPGASAVIGSRDSRVGDIQRTALRRTLGRLFSTVGSVALRRRIYDTQCGAKLFRSSPALAQALERRFRSRWAFDVELLGRYLVAAGRGGAGGVVIGGEADGAVLVEVPLRRWHEVPGSKMRPASMVRAGLDLLAVAIDLARLRREG